MHNRLGAAYDIALSAASTPGPHPLPVGVKAVRLFATGLAYVSIGPNPTAVIGASTLLVSGDHPLLAAVNAGDKIAVIASTGATGKLNVTELTH